MRHQDDPLLDWRTTYQIVQPHPGRFLQVSPDGVSALAPGFPDALRQAQDMVRRGRYPSGSLYSSAVDESIMVLDRGRCEAEPRIQSYLDQTGSHLAPPTVRKGAEEMCRLAHYLLKAGGGIELATRTQLVNYAALRRKTVKNWRGEQLWLFNWFEFLADLSGPWGYWAGRSPWPCRTIRGKRRPIRARGKGRSKPGEVRMLTLEEWNLFRSLGIESRHPLTGEVVNLPGTLAPEFPELGRAISDLVVAGALRWTETSLCLIVEFPTMEEAQGAARWPSISMRLGHERAKTSGGVVPLTRSAVQSVWEWWHSPSRALLVESAQSALGRRVRSGAAFVVEESRRDSTGHVTYLGLWRGEKRKFTHDDLPRAAAAVAVRREDGQWIPLTPWIGHNGGVALSPSRLREILFVHANARLAAWHRSGMEPRLPQQMLERVTLLDGRPHLAYQRRGYTPHMLRHTAAASWFVSLARTNAQRQLAERTGSSAAGSHATMITASGQVQASHVVSTWLRHVSEATLRHYMTWAERNGSAEGFVVPSVGELTAMADRLR